MYVSSVRRLVLRQKDPNTTFASPSGSSAACGWSCPVAMRPGQELRENKGAPVSKWVFTTLPKEHPDIMTTLPMCLRPLATAPKAETAQETATVAHCPNKTTRFPKIRHGKIVGAKGAFCPLQVLLRLLCVYMLLCGILADRTNNTKQLERSKHLH